ncbi:MAG TPA: methionyl-tRNA formyltransferase [Actinomycetota bacterium]
MRVVFLGNARWSIPPLEAVAISGHEVSLVLTRAPRLGGRGNRPIMTPVAEAARRLGLPLEEIETVKTGRGLQALADAHPDVLAVVAYGEIIPKAVLEVPRLAPVNVHFSLLPKLRGAAPVQRAILQGLDVTGVTTIRMDEGMDTGPMLLQAEISIRPEDDAGSLGDRLAKLGGRLLVETLDGLAAGTIQGRPQEHEAATYAPKLKPEERMIEWATTAEEIVRLVRAMSPEPGAATTFRGRGLRILWASQNPVPAGFAGPLHPGTIFQVDKEGLAVAVPGAFLRLEEVQPEGRKRMSGGDFVRGYRPQAGDRLGDPAGGTPAQG